MLGVMHVLDALTASCDGRITVQDAAQAYYESICASADSNSARAGARAKKIFGSPVPSKTYPRQLARRSGEPSTPPLSLGAHRLVVDHPPPRGGGSTSQEIDG